MVDTTKEILHKIESIETLLDSINRRDCKKPALIIVDGVQQVIKNILGKTNNDENDKNTE
jgi:hypothetical protein